LVKCETATTVIMVNVSYNPSKFSSRVEFQGVRRVVKLGIRVAWLRLEPIVAYGTIPDKEFLHSSIGDIFTSNQSHKYYDLARTPAEKLSSILREISPISDNRALRAIIRERCQTELRIYISSAIHLLEKTYKLDTPIGKSSLLTALQHLQALLGEGLVDEFTTGELIGRINSYNIEEAKIVTATLNTLVSKLASLKKALD
jgi:hypothetical protein